MSALINFSIDLSKVSEEDKAKGKYLNLTMSVQDETGTYGDNAGIFVSQSKEDREAKVSRKYLGNGKVVYVKDGITVADKVERQVTASEQSTAGRETPDLPF
jgi:hypothetical protein